MARTAERRASFGLLVCLLVGACASAPRPILQLNQTEKQIARAQAVNAREVPDAALHLKLAEDLLRSAKQLMREDENIAARHQLRRAEVDAELAEVLARKSAAQRDADEATNRLKALDTPGGTK